MSEFLGLDAIECENADSMEEDGEEKEFEKELEKLFNDSNNGRSIANCLHEDNKRGCNLMLLRKYDLISLEVSVPPPVI